MENDQVKSVKIEYRFTYRNPIVDCISKLIQYLEPYQKPIKICMAGLFMTAGIIFVTYFGEILYLVILLILEILPLTVTGIIYYTALAVIYVLQIVYFSTIEISDYASIGINMIYNYSTLVFYISVLSSIYLTLGMVFISIFSVYICPRTSILKKLIS